MIDFWTIIWMLIVGFMLHNLYKFWQTVTEFQDNGIPIKRPLWFMGNTWKAIFRLAHLCDVIQEFYNFSPEAKYVGFFDFANPVIFVRNPEIIKSIAVKNSEYFPDHRGFIDEKVDPLFGLNLFSLKGNKWHRVRALLSPAFTSSKMKMMFQLMLNCAENFSDFIVERSKNETDIVNLKDAFTRYANDVIATCAFGIQIDSMRKPKNDFYVLGRKAINFDGILSLKFFVLRSFPRITNLFKLRLFDKEVAKFFTNIVSQTIAVRDEQKISRPDMLQLMMDVRGKDNELDIDEMTAQAFVFFLAGFDTTATLMCFAAHEIAVSCDIQKKLQAEVDDVWEKIKGKIDYDAINNMRYLDAVINETLRMYPPALFVDRMCSKEFELPPTLPGRKPYTVKPGTNVWFPIYALHHDPQYFPNPKKFDPDRFFQKQVASNSITYMPFGLGPRVCIGNRFALLETKILLFQLLLKCNFKVTLKTRVPMEFSKSSFIFLPKGGFWIKLEPRARKALEL